MTIIWSALGWQKFPACTKRDKQNLKNYHPIPFLPNAGKILEIIFYNNTYEFSTKNNLISPNQSGFIPGGPCINQFLSIINEICKPFDDGLEVWGIFSDISKAFDKVWDKRLLYKVKENRI